MTPLRSFEKVPGACTGKAGGRPWALASPGRLPNAPLHPRSSGAAARRGMSLMEVVAALAVLVFGLGTIMGLYTQQVRGAGETRWALRADGLARSYLAQIQAVGYEGLRARYFKESDEAYFGDNPTVESTQDDAFWWGARLERQPAGDLPAKIRITVVVGWGTRPAGALPAAALEKEPQSRKAVGYAVAP